jgi:hypothetical protein
MRFIEYPELNTNFVVNNGFMTVYSSLSDKQGKAVDCLDNLPKEVDMYLPDDEVIETLKNLPDYLTIDVSYEVEGLQNIVNSFTDIEYKLGRFRTIDIEYNVKGEQHRVFSFTDIDYTLGRFRTLNINYKLNKSFDSFINNNYLLVDTIDGRNNIYINYTLEV